MKKNAYLMFFSTQPILNINRCDNGSIETAKILRLDVKYWVDAKVSADFFSFLCFKFLLKQNTINQQRIYHCYL